MWSLIVNMFKKNTQQNVYTSITPLYIFLKFFGIFLPSFDGNRSARKFRITIFDKIQFLITCSLLILMFKFMISEKEDDLNSSLLLDLVFKFSGTAGPVAILTLMIYQLKYRNQIINILKNFHEFDEEVN